MMLAKKNSKKLFDKLSDHANKIAGLVSATLVILGALAGLMSWLTTQMTSGISQQISEFRAEVKANDDRQNLAIMRLELLNLIENDPNNTIEIEILGKKYFQNGGNSYMSSMYSKYAQEHGLDTSFIVGGK